MRPAQYDINRQLSTGMASELCLSSCRMQPTRPNRYMTLYMMHSLALKSIYALLSSFLIQWLVPLGQSSLMSCLGPYDLCPIQTLMMLFWNLSDSIKKNSSRLLLLLPAQMAVCTALRASQASRNRSRLRRIARRPRCWPQPIPPEDEPWP